MVKISQDTADFLDGIMNGENIDFEVMSQEDSTS